jgi:lipopolysaccharide biosynthesis glycosyltransferase
MFHLAIAFDNNYLVPFYALACSIFENNKKTAFHFHCIIRNIEEKENIIEYLKENSSTISFYEVDENLIKNFVTMSHWNTSVYYKIFFPLLIDSSVKKVLYLDTDMLVVSSLKELYETDLADFPLAAVKDPYVHTEVYWELHTKENYFNSGMMLINTEKWNEYAVSEQALKVLNEEPEKIIYVDQDALNIILENKVLILPQKYNYTYTHIPQDASLKILKDNLKNIVVLHFTLSRPWHFLCKNRYRYLYTYYLQKTPKENQKAIIDFSFSKLIPYLRLRIVEFYLDSSLLSKSWRFIKRKL